MASAFERQALLFNLRVETVPKGAPAPTMKEVADILYGEWKGNRAITRLEELDAENVDQETLALAKRRPNNAVYIQDMRRHERSCEILLTLGDAAEADPTIVDLKSRRLTPVAKGTDGGVGFSAHLCLSYSPSAPPVLYRGTLERMHNLGRNTVITYMNRLLRNHARDNPRFRFVDDKGGDRAWRPRLASVTKESRSLASAVKTGRFAEVTLVQRKKIKEDILDQEPAFRVKEKLLKLSTEDIPPTDAGRMEWLNRITKKAKENDYDEVYVKLKPFNGTGDISSRFSTEVEDAADAVFSRHERIDLTIETGQCHLKIVPRIGDPLTAMLTRDSLWK